MAHLGMDKRNGQGTTPPKFGKVGSGLGLFALHCLPSGLLWEGVEGDYFESRIGRRRRSGPAGLF